MKIIKAGIELIMLFAIVFILLTLLLSAIVGCIWLWKYFIIGGFNL